jgi:hypothetical protein
MSNFQRAQELLRRIYAECVPVGTDWGHSGITRMIEESGLLDIEPEEEETDADL